MQLLRWVGLLCNLAGANFCFCHSGIMFCLKQESVSWPGPGVSLMSSALGHGPNTHFSWTLISDVTQWSLWILVIWSPLCWLRTLYTVTELLDLVTAHSTQTLLWQCQFSWGRVGGLVTGWTFSAQLSQKNLSPTAASPPSLGYSGPASLYRLKLYSCTAEECTVQQCSISTIVQL